MREFRDLMRWILMAVLLVLPESGFSRIHQSPLMELEGQGACLQCEQMSFFSGLEQDTQELLRPVQHAPRVYRAAVPKKHRERLVPVRKASPKPTKFRGSGLRTSAQAQSGSAFMKAIARAARAGRGRSKPGFCYSGVKAILRAAGIRTGLPGGSAVNAYQDLKRAGFHDDRSQCHSEGTVRVYRGLASGMSNTAARRFMNQKGYRYSAGDNHGHIEVVGGDGRYYYNSTGKTFSLDSVMGSRRQIIGCFVK